MARPLRACVYALVVILLLSASTRGGVAAELPSSCAIDVRQVDPSGGYHSLLTLRDPKLYAAVVEALRSLPPARQMPVRTPIGHSGLGLAFVGEACRDRRSFWVYRGFVESRRPGEPIRILRDVARIEEHIFAVASQDAHWSLGPDPWLLYLPEEQLCGAVAWAKHSPGWFNLRKARSVVISTSDAQRLSSHLRGLPPAPALVEVMDPPLREDFDHPTIGDVYLWPVSSCSPVPALVRIHDETIVVTDPAGEPRYYRDARSLRDLLYAAYPELALQ